MFLSAPRWLSERAAVDDDDKVGFVFAPGLVFDAHKPTI